MINYGKHYIDDDDIKHVVEVLKSDFLTTGPAIRKFEDNLKEFTGYDHAIVMNSGTAALHAAMFAAEIGEGDEVIIPAITFIATSNAVLYQGGTPVFADVEKDTMLIDIESVKKLINSKTKAIIAVDYAGQQCNYEELKKICVENKLYLISDACHSFGAVTSENKNQIADFVCYSFHPVKHITTGEGGAVLTNNIYKYSVMRKFINHGRLTINSFILGYNYRMSDISAALGISQLKKQPKFQQKRNEIAKKYDEELKCEKLLRHANMRHMYHLYVIKVKNRCEFIEQMQYKDIVCGIHYFPVYWHPYYDSIDYINATINCPNAENEHKKLVSLPIYYSLTEKEQDHVIQCANKFLESENDK